MSKIVLQDGKIINVDIEVGEDEFFRGLQKAVMIDDCFGLQEIWVYEFLKVDHGGRGTEVEFVDYYCSDKELTREQIIFQMMKRDCSRFDVVIPHKAFVLDSND